MTRYVIGALLGGALAIAVPTLAGQDKPQNPDKDAVKFCEAALTAGALATHSAEDLAAYCLALTDALTE